MRIKALFLAGGSGKNYGIDEAYRPLRVEANRPRCVERGGGRNFGRCRDISLPNPTEGTKLMETKMKIQEPPKSIVIPLPNLPEDAKPLEMVLIPAGTFMMGSPMREKDRYDDEGPQHQVTITKPFYMGKYEVIQAQWQAVMGGNPSHFKRNNLPVESVSWDKCQEFITKLNQLGKVTFRLPTEAEWEYACRAGTATRFYWGDDPDGMLIEEYAWYNGNSDRKTNEVGLKKPNSYDLYDMCGNVWEWCQDWYGSYDSETQYDPNSTNSGVYRVFRGGCWDSLSWYCRSAYRSGSGPGYWSDNLGFRTCLLYVELRRKEDREEDAIIPPKPKQGPKIEFPTQLKIQEPPKSIVIPLPNFPKCAKPLEMVLILAGTFMMGSPEMEKDRMDNEGPQHQVTITKPFYMGKYEVTQEQWQAVMGNNPSHFKGNNLPVERVSWDVCQTFIQKLNQMGQGTFRLPTEAEWEYACRAGTTTSFYWGDDTSYTQIVEYAWYPGNADSKTHAVGLKKPNAWGLYDMSGNVWEWCLDRFGDYSSDAQNDPTGANKGDYRVVRGGSWNDISRLCRSANRSRSWPDVGDSIIGFRIVFARS
ncbi:MAG: formylglycine-generating enzyme family protein [Candidatus Omnitrophota bacterium]